MNKKSGEISSLKGKGAILALLAANSCGPAAQVIRPADPTAEKTGDKACFVPEDPNSPLVVDWKGYQRQNLELSMQNGVAVVAFDCDELQLLPKCHVDGNYEFKSTTNQRSTIRLSNLDEIRANLPTSGLRLGEDLEADIKRGATLDIALQTVGRVVTSRSEVSRDLLRGECEGATHIVRGATIGAFSMNTNTLGQVGGNVGVVSGGGSSEKTVNVSSGDMEACEAGSADGKPPAKCNTPVRLHLEDIRDIEHVSAAQSIPNHVENNEEVEDSEELISLGLRGFYRTGEAEGYENAAMSGAMATFGWPLSDSISVHAGVGGAQLAGRSIVGTDKKDSDQVFAGIIGGSALLGSKKWPLAPFFGLNMAAQGHGMGGEAAFGIKLFPSHPFDIQLLGTYGVYDTGQEMFTNIDGKPTYPLKISGGGAAAEAGWSF